MLSFFLNKAHPHGLSQSLLCIVEISGTRRIKGDRGKIDEVAFILFLLTNFKGGGVAVCEVNVVKIQGLPAITKE